MARPARPPQDIVRPVLAVDVTLFGVLGPRLHVLLHRRPAEPFAGAWALPGAAVQADETLLQAARRCLVAKAGIGRTRAARLHLEQLATFDALYRDPRGRTVSVVHLGLTRAPGTLLGSPGSGGAAAGAAWFEAQRLLEGTLPFDHAQILAGAIQRLAGKLRYTNIAGHLLPATFCLDDLVTVYEAVLGRPVNRSNFRNKLLRIGLMEQVGELPQAVGRQGGRPPHLYRFRREQLTAEARDFL